jgi:hypothetical protein
MFAMKFKPVQYQSDSNKDFSKNKAKFLSFLEKVDEIDKKVEELETAKEQGDLGFNPEAVEVSFDDEKSRRSFSIVKSEATGFNNAIFEA